MMHIYDLDRSALVYQHHEQLYRLALLLAGDEAGAAKLVEQAYRALLPAPADAETQLIRALLRAGGNYPRGRLRIAEERLTYTALDRTQAEALLAILAAMPVPERLAVGLHYLRGRSADEIARFFAPQGPTSSPIAEGQRLARIHEILSRFRVAAAHALGLAPADADDATLIALDRFTDGRLPEDATITLRRAVFEQAAVRAMRDGLTEARGLLARAIPALFTAATPIELTARLLKQAQRHERATARRSMAWARAALALGVLALAAAIVLVPSLLRERAAPATIRAPDAAELIDSAIHRFDRATLSAGVLHEQYRVIMGGQPVYLIERWHDFATPHRLRITVRSEDAQGRAGPVLLDIGSDGRSMVQYRDGTNGQFSSRSFDAHVSEAEAQEALEVLRGEPSSTIFSRGQDDLSDIAPEYLAQARAAGATYLGQASMLGRPVFLLTYRTDRLPTWSPQAAPVSQPRQVILTIDAQTTTLLDITIVAEGEAASTAQHPLQAQAFEIVPEVPDALWQLPADDRVARRDGLPSARAPEIPSQQVIDLREALQRATHPILAPLQLPDEPMRGMAVSIVNNGDQQVLLLYEGQFQTLMLAPTQNASFAGVPANSQELSAGAFRYRMIESGEERAPRSAALAFRPELPDQQVLVMLVDEYATVEEREAALGQLIGSLTPVTEQNLPALQRYFSGPTTAGGQN
jgi:anti-sigma factor RsiW